MKPQPSPFWTKRRVPKKDALLLMHTHPELVNLLALSRPDISDPKQAFYVVFNSLSEEQRAWIYEWAEQEKQRRMQLQAWKRQIEHQAQITKLQQEIELKNQVELEKTRVELEQKYGLNQPSQMQPDNPLMPNFQQPEQSEQPTTLFGRLKARYKAWREKRKLKKQRKLEEQERRRQEEELMKMQMQPHQPQKIQRQKAPLKVEIK